MTEKKTKSGFITEFKEFAMRGNLIDLAVGVVVGGAFGKVISSFVNDVVMPPIGKLMGNVNFTELQVTIQQGVEEHKDANGNIIPKVAEVAIKYGAFLNTLVDFFIVAFVVFLVIKGVNRMKRKQAEALVPPAEPTKQELLLTEIRDLLKK